MSDVKRCNKCGEEKPLSGFFRDVSKKDGLATVCKPCKTAANKAWKHANLEKYRASVSKWKQKHEGYWRKYVYGDQRREYQQKWMAENPEKQKAHREVRREVRAGRLRPEPCHVCGRERAHAHHDDYSRPLHVIWLCAAHHKARHKWLDWIAEASA